MIGIGSDHGGDHNEIRGLDEPKVAIALSEAVASGEVEKGILICRSGIGMTIAANKVKGIKCALCYNLETAKSAKEHNNANVIALGADYIDLEDAIKFIETWKNSQFLDGIYNERLEIVEKYEVERK